MSKSDDHISDRESWFWVAMIGIMVLVLLAGPIRCEISITDGSTKKLDGAGRQRVSPTPSPDNPEGDAK